MDQTIFKQALNSDELREYHPSYQKLQSDPLLYSKASYLVNPDTDIWFNKLQADASIRGYNIVYDSTLGGNAGNYATSMQNRIKEGYQYLAFISFPQACFDLHLLYYFRLAVSIFLRIYQSIFKMELQQIEYKQLITGIGHLLNAGREKAAQQINTILVNTY